MGHLISEQVVNDHKQVLIKATMMSSSEWQSLLVYANNPYLNSVVVDALDDDILYNNQDSIHSHPPLSLAARLLAFLNKRFECFDGDVNKGLRISSDTVLNDELTQLMNVCLELAHRNNINPEFMDWLEEAIVY